MLFEKEDEVREAHRLRKSDVIESIDIRKGNLDILTFPKGGVKYGISPYSEEEMESIALQKLLQTPARGR